MQDSSNQETTCGKGIRGMISRRKLLRVGGRWLGVCAFFPLVGWGWVRGLFEGKEKVGSEEPLSYLLRETENKEPLRNPHFELDQTESNLIAIVESYFRPSDFPDLTYLRHRKRVDGCLNHYKKKLQDSGIWLGSCVVLGKTKRLPQSYHLAMSNVLVTEIKLVPNPAFSTTPPIALTIPQARYKVS